MGEACGRAEGGRRSRSVRECLFVWLRGMSASLPILQPHLGATSPEHSTSCVCPPFSLFLSLSPCLCLCLLSLSLSSGQTFIASCTPSHFFFPWSCFLCFLVVPLLQGLYVTDLLLCDRFCLWGSRLHVPGKDDPIGSAGVPCLAWSGTAEEGEQFPRRGPAGRQAPHNMLTVLHKGLWITGGY